VYDRERAITKLTNKKLLYEILNSNETELYIYVKKTDIDEYDGSTVNVYGDFRDIARQRLVALGESFIAQNDKSKTIPSNTKMLLEKLNNSQSPVQNEDEYIAKNDGNPYVRAAATDRLNDQELLTSIAKNDESDYVRATAISKLTDQEHLSEICRNKKASKTERIEAVRKLKNQDILADIAKNDKDYEVRIEAVIKVKDQSVLAYVALYDQSPYIRRKAVDRLTDKKALAKVAINVNDDNMGGSRAAAIRKLTDKEVLATIAGANADGYKYEWHEAFEDQSRDTIHTVDLRETARNRLAELQK
jgi:hypothetical protein